MKELIKVLYFKINEEPELLEIENDLSALQKLVGGYIQVVPLKSDLYLICNETGRLDNLQYQERYNIYGDFLVAKALGDELTTFDEILARRVLKEIDDLLNILL